MEQVLEFITKYSPLLTVPLSIAVYLLLGYKVCKWKAGKKTHTEESMRDLTEKERLKLEYETKLKELKDQEKAAKQPLTNEQILALINSKLNNIDNKGE